MYLPQKDTILEDPMNYDKAISIIKDRWEEIKEETQKEYEIVDALYNTWIKPLTPAYFFSKDGRDTLLIIFPDGQDFMIDYIEHKYHNFIKTTIESVTGIDVEVEFSTIAHSEQKNVNGAPVTMSSLNSNLNPKYTFDTFVVGANNKFAHAASLAVAESPAERYNPLFIYGGVGLGKTHLMHSIAHYILKNKPDARILYITSEQFTNELIDAIKDKSNTATSEFRNKYRNIDVLLIDDIQFIADKESTQEEFFHTFNHLHTAKKQIVISSDKPPKALTTLAERLRSRFEMGLTVDISAPDYETRMAILRKKEELEGFSIDNEVIKYIASNIKTNIREIEGALTKIIAFSKLNKTDITLDVAEEALRDFISPDDKKELTPDYILKVVADHYGITVNDLISDKRIASLTTARQVAMYLCRSLTNLQLKKIGALLGGRDHATVIHGITKIENELETNPSLASTIDILKKKLSLN